MLHSILQLWEWDGTKADRKWFESTTWEKKKKQFTGIHRVATVSAYKLYDLLKLSVISNIVIVSRATKSHSFHTFPQ